MTPKITYNKIINNARLRNPDSIKGEWHHIIPKCMGGSNDPNNFVKLTYREHYFCHYLLTRMHPNIDKLFYAFNLMNNDGKHGKRISSRLYERFKIEFSKINSENGKRRFRDKKFVRKIREGDRLYKESEIGRSKNSESMKSLWNDEEWRKSKSQQQSKYMMETFWGDEDYKNEIHRKTQKSKCLYYMWRYLSKYDIENPTDKELVTGWKTRKGFSDLWRKYYKDSKEWIKCIRDYLNTYPIKDYQKADYSQSHEHIRKRQRGIKLCMLWKMANNGELGSVIDLDNIPKNIKWQKWFDDENDWITSIIEYMKKYPIEGVILKVDNQQPSL